MVRCPLAQVCQIKPPGLDGENSANIVELRVGDASAIAIPNQFCEDDVFGRRSRNLQNAAVGKAQFGDDPERELDSGLSRPRKISNFWLEA